MTTTMTTREPGVPGAVSGAESPSAPGELRLAQAMASPGPGGETRQLPAIASSTPGLSGAVLRSPTAPTLPDPDPMALTSLLSKLANELYSTPPGPGGPPAPSPGHGFGPASHSPFQSAPSAALTAPPARPTPLPSAPAGAPAHGVSDAGRGDSYERAYSDSRDPDAVVPSAGSNSSAPDPHRGPRHGTPASPFDVAPNFESLAVASHPLAHLFGAHGLQFPLLETEPEAPPFADAPHHEPTRHPGHLPSSDHDRHSAPMRHSEHGNAEHGKQSEQTRHFENERNPDQARHSEHGRHSEPARSSKHGRHSEPTRTRPHEGGERDFSRLPSSLDTRDPAFEDSRTSYVPPGHERRDERPRDRAESYDSQRSTEPTRPRDAGRGSPIGYAPGYELSSSDPSLQTFSRKHSGGGSLDAHALRREFPILRERANGKPLVWLDNAATTQKPKAVIDRLTYFYEHENSNVHRAAHTLAARATDAYESARESVRRFIHASSTKEIVFVRGATEGVNLVAQSWGRRHVRAGDEIVISWLEHHANIVPWQMLCSETGARLRVAPVDDRGQILLDEYEKLLGPKTRIVAFTQVSNALGTITPAKAMVDMAHRHGAIVLVDGAQAVSHMPVDVQDLGCDYYVFSGHKVFGPTGIGVVYGKHELLDATPPWQGGGNMIQDVTFERTVYQPAPSRFEAGTGNIADAVGLGAALDWLRQVGIERVERYEHELLAYGTERLSTVPGLTLIGTAKEKAGVLSFVLAGQKTEQIGGLLDQEGIAVRSGHHCAQPILRRFGLEATVRASLAPYNTYEDIDALVAALHRVQSGHATPRSRGAAHHPETHSPSRGGHHDAAHRDRESHGAYDEHGHTRHDASSGPRPF